MQFKDAARNYGRVGLLLPLVLIFFTAADSAFACPEHTSRVAYRTKSINSRTVSYMPTTVISYRAPASYRRCGANMYDTRGARYVAARSYGNQGGSSARYVAVRNDNAYYKLRQPRRVAVRNVDYGYEPRYVAVRPRYPVYHLSGNRYAEIRSGYRSGNGIVRFIDVDEDETRYAVVKRVVPRTKYVAVRNIDVDDYDEPRYVAVRRVAPRTRYVAVRNIDSGCTRAVALRGCLADVGSTSTRRVVLRSDDDTYAVRTKHVVLEDGNDDDAYMLDNDTDDVSVLRDDSDDDEYVAVANETPAYVEYAPAAYSSGNGATYVAANDFDTPCARSVAVRTCRPDAVSGRTIAYEVYDDDLDGQAVLHNDDVAYVAADDMEDACLPGRVGTSTRFVTTRAVNYVPAEYVAEDASPLRSEAAYVETSNAAVPWPRWVAKDEDQVFDDVDPTWVAEVEDTCSRQHAHCGLVDELAAGRVNFVPVDDVVQPSMAAVSYVPVDEGEAIRTEAVSYEPADEADVESVSYVPADDVHTRTVNYITSDDVNEEVVSSIPFENVDEDTVGYMPLANANAQTVSYVPVETVGTRYIVADDCPMLESRLDDAEPVDVDDSSAVLVEEVEGDQVADPGDDG